MGLDLLQGVEETFNFLSQSPIPKAEDLFATWLVASFSKLDMRQAYQQIELDDESKPYVVINTH